jgi:hypothetical protein
MANRRNKVGEKPQKTGRLPMIFRTGLVQRNLLVGFEVLVPGQHDGLCLTEAPHLPGPKPTGRRVIVGSAPNTRCCNSSRFLEFRFCPLGYERESTSADREPLFADSELLIKLCVLSIRALKKTGIDTIHKSNAAHWMVATFNRS